MRKQDRIAREQLNRPERGSESRSEQEPREREQIRGGDISDQPTRPPRQPGEKLPLPD